MLAVQRSGEATHASAGADPPGDYWRTHVPCKTQRYELSESLNVLIHTMAFVGGVDAHSAMQYLKLRGVKFTKSKSEWRVVQNDSEMEGTLRLRINTAAQNIRGRTGRTRPATTMKIMSDLGVSLGKEGGDQVWPLKNIPEPVNLPFSIMWYEEWENKMRQNEKKAAVLLPDRNMFEMGQDGPKHIQNAFKDDTKTQLTLFRNAIRTVVDNAIDMDDKQLPKNMERMNNGVMITTPGGGSVLRNTFWDRFKNHWKSDHSDPLFPLALNEIITDKVSQEEGCKLICEQGYVLDSCLRDRDEGLGSPRRAPSGILDMIRPGKSQPAHIDADDGQDENGESVIAGCMYFQDTVSTITYDMRGIPSTFGDDMNWDNLHKDIWSDSPPGLKEHLQYISEDENNIGDRNPLAWLQSFGRVAYSNPTQRLKASKVQEFDIVYFNSDTVHCGPVLPYQRRTSYFFLLRKLASKAVQDTTKVKEHGKKVQEQKSSQMTKKRKLGKEKEKAKLQTTKEKFLLAIFEIVNDRKGSRLEWKLYLLRKVLYAIAESVMYGASDKSISWEGKFLYGLKELALPYADLADKVFMSLKRKEWSEAQVFSVEMGKILKRAVAYVTAHHDMTKALEM